MSDILLANGATGCERDGWAKPRDPNERERESKLPSFTTFFLASWCGFRRRSQNVREARAVRTRFLFTGKGPWSIHHKNGDTAR